MTTASASATDHSISRLIVIEGIDGSGSTTQLHRLAQYLQQKEVRTVVTHEPSDGPVGMLIRLALQQRLLGPNYQFHDPRDAIHGSGTALDNYTLALLFAADRADHVASQIETGLRSNRHVLCDRYVLSTLAYQGLSCDLDWLLEINKHVRRPDLTFFLDVDPDLAHDRMKGSRWLKDLFEDPEHQKLIRRRYLELIDQDISVIGPVLVVDAARPPGEVTKDLRRALERFLKTGRVEAARGELTLL